MRRCGSNTPPRSFPLPRLGTRFWALDWADFLCAIPTPDLIDKATKEIKQDDDETVYKSLEEIGDDLPDHSPRFVLLSYPMTLVSKQCTSHEYHGSDCNTDDRLVCRTPAGCRCHTSFSFTFPSHATASFGCSTPALKNSSGTRPR